MHPRNRYLSKHDFSDLLSREPGLSDYLITTPAGKTSLDFGEPEALLLLNRTLLKRDYGLAHWDIPRGHLIPPIPGRLDYVHTLADLIGAPANVLDIGTGAGLIYPVLGALEYDWTFVATDIDPKSVKVASAIAAMNKVLRGRVEVRLQRRPDRIFAGVIHLGERYNATLCNPPFYASRAEAEAAGHKKWAKLGRRNTGLSFGGSDGELYTEGGEPEFLRRMIGESVEFRDQVGWFTTLVSKRGYLRTALTALERIGASQRKVIDMKQGNKKSRVLAWSFD